MTIWMMIIVNTTGYVNDLIDTYHKALMIDAKEMCDNVDDNRLDLASMRMGVGIDVRTRKEIVID